MTVLRVRICNVLGYGRGRMYLDGKSVRSMRHLVTLCIGIGVNAVCVHGASERSTELVETIPKRTSCQRS